ncbi:MAG TPA: nuclear transport factor 2 family protein [Pseudoxanthomonas sp.]
MTRTTFLPNLLLAFSALAAFAPSASAAVPDAAPAQDALTREIAALDATVFDAFNHCGDPARLQEHASYFAADVEFYHDTGGVTWTRDAMIANTGKHVCGNFTRELIPDSMKVYPIKDFGAVSQGAHRFCQIASGKCEGLADFVIVWRQRDGKWEITRVLSYGHRAMADSQ